jgi:lysozyme family protein
VNYPPAFIQAVEFALKWEGEVFENDPDDPGGATKFGIDQRSHPDVDIRSLTRSQAIGIYHADYWQKIRGDEFHGNLAWVLFDIAVNNGRSRGVKWMQEGLEVTADGIIGAITIRAAAYANVPQLCEYLLDRREKFYRQIAKGRMAKFLRGWLNRNNDLRKAIG